MKICYNCGNEFEDENKRKIYCCHKCYSRAKAKRFEQRAIKNGQKNYRYKNKICVRCNEEYSPNHSKQKYCSSECFAWSRRKYLSIPDCLESASRKLDKKIGYVRVYCPMHPEANTWGYVY